MNADKIEKDYLKWLSDNEKYTDLSSNSIQIDTPFLDASLDYITIYVDFTDHGMTLTDDGWTLDYLETHGFTFRKGSYRYKLLHSILKTFGLKIISESIQLSCNKENFPVAKQRMLQGLMKINDLIFLNDSNTINTFKSDVIYKLTSNKVFYDAPYTVSGDNGYTYSFDFSIPQLGGKKKLVNTITQPNRIDFSKLFVIDAKLSSSIVDNASFFAVLNDSKKINNYDEIKYIFESEKDISVTPILMSDNDKFKTLLTNK